MSRDGDDRHLRPRRLRRRAAARAVRRAAARPTRCYWQDMPDEPGYWAVLRHADVVHVARRAAAVLGRARAGVVLEDLDARAARAMMQDMLLAMDPPRTRLPAHVAPSFKARVMAELEDRIREICRAIMRRRRASAARSTSCTTSRALLPSQVIGELVGIPREDWPQIHHWAELNTGGQDPDIVGDRVTRRRASRTAQHRHGDVRDRSSPRERRARNRARTSTSLILATEFDGEPMNDIEFGSFFVQLVTAGNDTTADDAVVGPARAARSTPTSWPSCAPTHRSSPARSRRSCAGRTRCTTSGAPRPPTPSSTASRSRPATRWR